MSVPSELAERRAFNWRAATAPGIQAVRHSWAPVLVIQAAAAVLVLSYYRSSSLQSGLVWLQDLKARGGVLFDVACGFSMGGILPQLAKAATGKARLGRDFLVNTTFNGFVYAVVAIEIDAFYRLQTFLFGTGIDPYTLARKVALDMGAFTPILSIPTAVLLFEWRKAEFSAARCSGVLRNGFYRGKVMPALIPCWAFWIPMLFLVYAMPRDLQFPLAQLASASWAVLFVFIAGEPT